MKIIIERLSYIPFLWIGAGGCAWFIGLKNVGMAGVFLGMFSGIDFYHKHPKQSKCYWAMFILGMIGIPTGIFYEHFISKQPLLLILLYGAFVGIFFAFVVTGVDLLLCRFFRKKHDCTSPSSISSQENAAQDDQTDQI